MARPSELAMGAVATQEFLVESIAPALPAYRLTKDDWFGIMLHLRMLSRATEGLNPSTRLFYEDLSRVADAMQNRLSGSTVYAGREELDRALGPVENAG